MREFVFTIEYPSGADPLVDVFIDHPDLVAASLTMSVSKTGMWRVDRVSGSDGALEAFRGCYTDSSYCIECGGDDHECTSEWTFEVISEASNTLTVYSFLERLPAYCHSIPHLAVLEFGDGLVFDAQRRENVYEWRVLLPGDDPVGTLFDRLSDGFAGETQVTLRQITTPSRWGEGVTTIADLPHEQREAVETAVREGYYSTPRSIDLANLAALMEVPKSTLRYRLRRAEAWVIESFVANQSLLDFSPDAAILPGDKELDP